MCKKTTTIVLTLMAFAMTGCELLERIGESGLNNVANAVVGLEVLAEETSATFGNDVDRLIKELSKLPEEAADEFKGALDGSMAEAREHTGLTIDYAEYKFQSNVEDIRSQLLRDVFRMQSNGTFDADKLVQTANSVRITPFLARPNWKTPVVKTGGVYRESVELDWANKLMRARDTTIELHGFGMQRSQRNDPSWRIEFFGPNKDVMRHAVANAWQCLTIQSDFRATLHLRHFIDEARDDDSVLVIAYGDTGKNARSEIDLKHNNAPPAPERKSVRESLGRQSYTPPHTRGDTDFWGSIRFKVEGEYRISKNGKLETRVSMFATEVDSMGRDRKDHTTASGNSDWRVAYTPEPGWSIVEVNVTNKSVLRGRIQEKDAQPIRYPLPNGELVRAFLVNGVKPKGIAGTNSTSVIAEFNTVTIILERPQPAAK